MLGLSQEKIWNKNVCAEEGKYMLYESSELKNKIVRTEFYQVEELRISLSIRLPPSHIQKQSHGSNIDH